MYPVTVIKALVTLTRLFFYICGVGPRVFFIYIEALSCCYIGAHRYVVQMRSSCGRVAFLAAVTIRSSCGRLLSSEDGVPREGGLTPEGGADQ